MPSSTATNASNSQERGEQQQQACDDDYLWLQFATQQQEKVYPAASEFEMIAPWMENEDDDDEDDKNKDDEKQLPAHLATVWDFKSRYAGELYTITWERALMKEVSDSVTQLIQDWAQTAGKGILALTAAAPLVVASVLPLAILKVRTHCHFFTASSFR